MPRPLHILVNLLAITLITFLGVDTFYGIVRVRLWQSNARQAPVLRHVVREMGEKRATTTYEAIIRRNLFGVSLQDGKEAPLAEIKDLEPTTLQVRLLGTIVGDKETGRAVIEDLQNKSQGLYRVDDDIQGARVRKILRGKVVLQVNGQDEILVMEENEAKAKPAAGPSRRRPVPASRSRRGRVPAAGSTFTLNREEIAASLDNIGDILSQVRVQPFMEEGKTKGLQLNDISPNSIFESMGLQDGDVVQAVNNKQIESPEDVVSLYQNLKAGSRLNLQINRNGQQEILNYNIR